MLSESARMTSAAEARFRVQAPNSTPRAIRVIALDAVGEAVVRRLAAGGWRHATFLTTVSHGQAGDAGDLPHSSADDTLTDLAGQIRSVAAEVEGADLVVFVAGPGGHAQTASLIGEACSLRRVMTTGLVVDAASAPEHALSKTLAQLRPWSLMIVIAGNDDYIDDIMAALRA
jgi:NAD(P)-dependent dehydrogenase (short-subunit alcohol dehydrogenase family)